MRVARLLRLVRIVRVVSFFRSLRVLIQSIIGTLKSVVWALLLLILIMYTFSILFTQAYAEQLEVGTSESLQAAARLGPYYGGVVVSSISLFMAISGGISWVELYHPLEELSSFWAFVFLVYVSFVYFAVLNTVTGVFCQSAIESASLDHEMVMEAQIADTGRFVDRCHQLFDILDHDKSGAISRPEFKKHLKDHSIVAFFESMDLDTTNAMKLFNLLAGEDKVVDIDEFVIGCLRLRGMATRIDCEMVLSVARKTEKSVERLEQSLGELLQQLPPGR
eukprot:TRINITY_DN84870_c0_g1_i1.p1 TRINITY_DN84870_c0_g1~~TRINITY_DN84870_c0_g1_i1.p1  ORF type:complete len:327 (-),score=59.95 TRINITY_DN84870_c0_g1_i1:150-983(-)